MASENYRSFAIKKGYYDPEKDGKFNWKKAYSPSPYSAAGTNGSRGRMWRFYDLVAPSREFDPATPNMEFPFSIKPEKKLSVQDVMNMTRDTFEGTPYAAARGIQGGPFKNPNHLPYGFTLKGKKYNTPRVIGVNRAEYITVTQCRGWLPDHIGGITWVAFGAQDTSCYMPFYAGVTAIPDSFKVGDHWEFDRRSARWAFDYTDYHTQPLYSYAIQDIRKAQEKWEGEAVRRTPRIDQRAQELYREDPDQAREYLTEYCINNAKLVIDAWWELGDRLLVKYNHLWIYDIENRKRKHLEYPEWWLEELVRYNQLEPVEEKE
jgi:dipeptidase